MATGFQNIVSFNGSASQVFDAAMGRVAKQRQMEMTYDYMAKLDYVQEKALNPNEVFASDYGVKSLDTWNEGAPKKNMPLYYGPDKGFEVVQYGNKIETTKLFSKWADKAQNLKGAPESVQAELYKYGRNMQKLLKGADRTYAEQMVKQLVDGFSISSAYGPGSATPKGKALFATDHSVDIIGTTQSNLINDGTNPNPTLSAVALQAALDQSKGMLFDNGHRVTQPKVYKLFVSPVKAVTARNILNTTGDMAGVFNGDTSNNNANVLNTFNFKGNLVEIVELDILGTYDNDNAVIGSDEYRFVSNPMYMQEARALKFIELYGVEARTYRADDTENEIAEVSCAFATDHYGAELGIFGSNGTES